MNEWLVFLGIYVLGRIASLVVYQLTWESGKSKKFPLGSSALGLCRRPIVVVFFLLLWLPTLSLSWAHFPVVRMMSVTLACLLMVAAVGRWGAANLDRYFVADRILLVFLAIGVWYAPCFFMPCLLFSSGLQYTVSSFRLGPGYSNLLGFEFVRSSASLLAVALALSGLIDVCGAPLQLFDRMAFAALLLMQSSNYVSHAIAKSALGSRWDSWFRENRLEFLLGNAWLRGWILGRSADCVVAQMKWLAKHRIACCFCVWLLEFSWIFFFADHRFTVFLLIATMVFHLLIFLITGLLSYHYLVNHACLVVILANGNHEIFHPVTVLICLVIVPLTTLWIGRVRMAALGNFRTQGHAGHVSRWLDAADHLMAWWDSPLMRVYSYRVITEGGKSYDLPVVKMSPYDTTLTDLPTHLMVLGTNRAFDSAVVAQQNIACTGVWGLTIDRKDRDFLIALLQECDGVIRDALGGNPQSSPWKALPECVIDLREMFVGMNRSLGKSWYRKIMRWPHCPGEDLVPDLCPLVQEKYPAFAFDEKIAAVQVRCVRTFIAQDRMILLDVSDVGVIEVLPHTHES